MPGARHRTGRKQLPIPRQRSRRRQHRIWQPGPIHSYSQNRTRGDLVLPEKKDLDSAAMVNPVMDRVSMVPICPATGILTIVDTRNLREREMFTGEAWFWLCRKYNKLSISDCDWATGARRSKPAVSHVSSLRDSPPRSLMASKTYVFSSLISDDLQHSANQPADAV